MFESENTLDEDDGVPLTLSEPLDTFEVPCSTSEAAPSPHIDVNRLIADLQLMCKSQTKSPKEIEKHVSRIHDQIQKRVAEWHHTPEAESESLKDLDAEHRELCEMYEDVQMTLTLLMREHRSVMMKYIGTAFRPDVLNESDRSKASDAKSAYDAGTENFLDLATGMNAVLNYEEKRHETASKLIRRLETENKVLREVLNIDTEADVSSDLNNTMLLRDKRSKDITTKIAPVDNRPAISDDEDAMTPPLTPIATRM